MVSPPAPWVTSATPASAIVAAASVAFRSVTPPRQKPWLIVTLPPRLGAGADLLDIEQAHLAQLVQVNVEPNAVPRRDREDTVELSFRVAVDLQRIDAAHQIGAVADGRVEQVENARAAHHATLRERNDLHRRPIAIVLTCRKHAVQLRQATFEIDVDMGAHV